MSDASRESWLTAQCVDSESRFLATKIFLGPPASCLGLTGQKRRSCESRVTDSQHAIWRAHRANEKFERGERRAMPQTGQQCGDQRRSARDIQMPSLDLSRSFTTCGLALPPDDFMTWPTNQPSACGLAFACATLSGLTAMISSTTFSMAERSVTCFMPRASDTSRGAPPSVQTISNRSFAILPEIVPSPIRSTIAASCAADTGET